MGIFDLFKKKQNVSKEAKTLTLPPLPKETGTTLGNSQIEYVKLTQGKCNRINKFFIAFDLETTGLSPELDRIIEIGAVAFEQGTPVEEFSTLVNPGRSIPTAATAVNGITNDMVSHAPGEWDALQALLSFFEKYSNYSLIFVGHNANFDFSFLKNALNRYGISKSFQYFDTLHASRSLIKGLPNYKQSTVAAHFGLVNRQAHRAAADALVCGNILLKLVPSAKKDPQEFILEEKNIPTREEMAVCAYIQKLIVENGGHPEDFTYYKNSGNYVTISSFYEVVRFKFAKKGHYIIIEKAAINCLDNPTEDCTSSEGGTGLSRVFFTHPAQLSGLQNYFYEKYKTACSQRNSFFDNFPFEKKRYYDQLPDMIQLSIQTMNQLIDELDPRTLDSKSTVKQDSSITREMITIDVTVTRKPLSQIKNKHNWDKGFDQGFPFYERAEEIRKNGSENEIRESLILFDQARELGYFAPALYDSYAKAYRKLKDYQNEILICEEGISRFLDEHNRAQLNPTSCDHAIGGLTARRNKAIQLLYRQQNSKAKH